MAFDRECPGEGWEKYQLGAGKFLLGAGRGKKLHDEGGSGKHMYLPKPEIPSHNHAHSETAKYLVQVHGKNTTGTTTDDSPNEINISRGFPIEMVGGNKAHNNMPPYLVLQFCKKK